MKILELTAENVKRIRAVYIKPDQHVQIVGGRNAQGKTSVLDAIWLALGGGAASRETAQPIRDGEDRAQVELNLDGKLLVTRTWRDGKSTLRVESGDGAAFRSPQAMLDRLVGRLSFDPLEFTRLSARDQLAALLELVDLDIDLDQLARERQQHYDARTEVGRGGKLLEGQLAGLGKVEDAPAVEESVAAVVAEMRVSEAAIQQQQSDLRTRDQLLNMVADLESRLGAARAQLEVAESRIANHDTVADPALIEERLEQVETINAAVRRNAERRRVADQVAAARVQYASHTTSIELLDRAKADALAAAVFPVDGLGFDDAGVTFNGIPFSQASAAEQIRVSLGMAMSLNPELRVIRILDGSLLDADNLALIEQMARDHDYQIWIERVGDADASAVIIEDGAVK